MADSVRPITTAPSVRAAQNRAEADHADRVTRVIAELTSPRRYGKFNAPNEESIKAWHRAARAAAKQLGQKVTSRRTRDGAVLIVAHDPNPLREQLSAAQARNIMDDLFAGRRRL